MRVLNRVLIKPIALYGYETRAITTQIEKKLLKFEMATLRTILGMRKLDKIHNDDIRKRVRCTNTLVKLLYAKQHKKLGHVFRMGHELIAKKVLYGKVKGTIRRRNPSTT